MMTHGVNPYLNDDFGRKLMALSDEEAPKGPILYYDPDSDSIEFLVEMDSHNDERVGPLLTVYYSSATGRMIGSKIKGVKELLRKHKFLAVMVRDGKVKLDHLIIAGGMSTAESDPLIVEYQKVYEPLMELIRECAHEVEIPELVLA